MLKINLYCIRACLKNHSRNLHIPLCGIFRPNSVAVARYGVLIWAKFPTNCDAHLAESLFQIRSNGLQVFFTAVYFFSGTGSSRPPVTVILNLRIDWTCAGFTM